MNKTKSYMWVYTNGEYEQEGYQIWLYEYQPSRSGSFAGAFLRGYAGTLITDGYSGYERLDSQSHVLCWAHVRKCFVDALPQDLSPEEEEASISGQAITKINELFALGKDLADKTLAKR